MSSLEDIYMHRPIALLALAALLSLGLASPASAHFLWLEPEADGARLYFGEFEENLREASPGLLDRLTPLPEAKLVASSGAKPLKVEKFPTSFVITGGRGLTDSIVAEQVRVTERKQGDKVTRTLGRLAARYVPDFSERAPTLALDVVPAGKPGAFKVVYKDKPLAKAKLELINESGWKRELRTDEQGTFAVALPWKGNYVIEVEHLDPTAGTQGAEAYDGMRFVSTLSFRVAEGGQAPPTPAALTPKREMNR
jgi:Domain of unknown function (DUF4198)